MSVTEELDQKKRDVFLSRASSRKELAATVHDLVIPAVGTLQRNDKVTQEVCKGLMAALDAMTKQIEADAKRITAIETMSFGARLRWAFTFTPKKDA